MGLYEKYKDTETSPATESRGDTRNRSLGVRDYFTKKGNCYLYEKMGYYQTGKTTVINENLTLVFYEKV